MGIFNNIGRFTDFDIGKYIRNLDIQIQGTGLKLDSNNNYDIQQRRLTNVGKELMTVVQLQNIKWKQIFKRDCKQNQTEQMLFLLMVPLI